MKAISCCRSLLKDQRSSYYLLDRGLVVPPCIGQRSLCPLELLELDGDGATPTRWSNGESGSGGSRPLIAIGPFHPCCCVLRPLCWHLHCRSASRGAWDWGPVKSSASPSPNSPWRLACPFGLGPRYRCYLTPTQPPPTRGSAAS